MWDASLSGPCPGDESGGGEIGGGIGAASLGVIVIGKEGDRPQASECEVELQYRPIRLQAYNHAYIRYRVTKGPLPKGFQLWSGVLEGQPQLESPLVKIISISVGGTTYPLRLIMDWGKLLLSDSRDGTGDSLNDPIQTTASGDERLTGSWVCDSLLKMMAAIRSYSSHPAQYWPFGGPNSNSAAHSLLAISGLDRYFTAPPRTDGEAGWSYPIFF